MVNLLLLVFIYIVWGTTYTAISLALKEFSPFILAALRYTISGLIFLPFTKREDWNFTRAWPHFFGGICLTFANSLVVWSQQKMPSGLAALFVGTVPLWFMVLNWFAFEKKKPAILSLFGLMVGMSGLMYLSYSSGKDMSLRLSAMALVFSTFIWSIGSLTIKKAGSSHQILPSLSIQLLTGGLFLFIPAYFNGESLPVDVFKNGIGPMLGLGYLIFFGTILAMNAYVRVLKNMSPHVVGTYALMNPIIAMVLGQAFLGESLSIEMVVATVLVLGGVGIILASNKLQSKKLAVSKI